MGAKDLMIQPIAAKVANDFIMYMGKKRAAGVVSSTSGDQLESSGVKPTAALESELRHGT